MQRTPLTRRNALKVLVTTAGLTTVTPLVGESAESENNEVEEQRLGTKYQNGRIAVGEHPAIGPSLGSGS